MAEETKKPAPEADGTDKDTEFHREAVARYDAAWQREQENITAAYEDLEFLTGEQWDLMVKAEREAENRPCMTINELPQFIRQITGDIRQMRPAIKCVPVDDRGDPKTAKVNAGLIRYIENRSAASTVYYHGADSQVQAGIGHWRVITEYASDTTFEQEIRIDMIEDGVGVLWDPDAIRLDRSDAGYCFVPIDMSTGAFEKKYPDASTDSFGDQQFRAFQGWYLDDSVRVAEYWYKEPIKRKLLVFESQIDDLTDASPEELAEAQDLAARASAQGLDVRIEERDGYQVMRAVISGSEVLEEPKKWPGRYIPIVPVIGEQIQVGRKRFRHGAIRFARDPQRLLNYYMSADTEIVALQPKSPFVGTEKNFERHQDEWENANTQNLPFLTYTPDPANGGARPERVQPPVSSQGIREGLQLASEKLRATTGIYDASLGRQSNETSGKAIIARQREGDTGSYVYVENFSQAVGYTGRIVLDLIPHIYDTARTVRIVGEDGKEELVKVNQPAGVAFDGVGEIQHDVTVGAYDIVMEMGPSYNTRREEAREGMTAFLQSAPDAAPAVLDLVAKAQDWPMADEIGERLEAIMPPQMKAALAAKKGEPPPPPTPEQQAQAQAEQQQQELIAQEHQLKLGELQVKGKELQLKEAELEAKLAALAMPTQPAADPRVEQLAATVQEMGQVLGAIVQILQPQQPAPESQMPVEQPIIPTEPPQVPLEGLGMNRNAPAEALS
jgi:hypothetical protein